MPIFPVLNGSVKTPLRWYSDERLTSWNCFPCNQSDAEWDVTMEATVYAIISPRNTLPPFQFWKPITPIVPAITSWKLYNLSGVEIGDLTSSISAITRVALLEEDRYIYFGNGNLGALQTVRQYSQITFDDGEVYTSELFIPTCEVGDDDVFLDQTFSEQGLIGWGVGNSGNEADATKNNPGAPSDPFPFEDKVTLGLNDGLLWEYNAGVWGSTVPTNLEYRLVKFGANAGQWWQYTTLDGWGLMEDPPILISTGACFVNNPDDLGLTLDNGQGVDFDSIVTVDTVVSVRICVGPFTSGSLDVTVGDTTYSITDTAGGCFTFSATYPGGATQFIAIAVVGHFDGCISTAEITRSASAINCNLMLEWTNCGDVGWMYYETDFVNRFILPNDARIIRPTPVFNTEQTENGRKDQLQDFFRKEVEYHLPVGMVPWHVADALTEIPGNDTIRLRHLQGFGTDTIIRVRTTFSWPEAGKDCVGKLDIFFQVEEATVVTACCDTFAPECDLSKGPGEITSMECFNDDCAQGYVFTADIPEGFYGQLLLSTDGGNNYEETDLQLTSEEWADNEIPVEAIPGLYAILTYFADCELGLTDDRSFGCEEGFAYGYDFSAVGQGQWHMPPSDPLPIEDRVEIHVWKTDHNGVDRGAYWLAAADQFFAHSQQDPDNTILFNITGVSDQGTYVELTVEYVSGTMPTVEEIMFCIGYGEAV